MDKIAVLDFGSQYSQLITRRVRELGVFAELLPWQTQPDQLKEYTAIILSGGPNSVYESGAPTVSADLFKLDRPVLGICYGMQLTVHVLGGKVSHGAKHEYGKTPIETGQHPLFKDVKKTTEVWMSHGDQADTLPDGFLSIATSANTEYAAIGHDKQKIYGLQFHPEVVHTPEGKTILSNWLFKIVGCQATWQPGDIVEQTIAAIRRQVGDGYVLSALSGGVDSTVCSVLLHRAIGDHLIPVFVDQGVLRLGEAEQVERTLRKLGLNLVVVNAQQEFLTALEGISDPEEKRKIIGVQFIKTFEHTVKKIDQPISFLAQGTLYPDVIESAASQTGQQVAQTIKTHHNVGGLPKSLKWQLVEPFRLLFKDEVRQIGKELGLPDAVVYRQPFPGPGLAIRIIGAVTPEKLEVLRQADTIVTEEIKAARWHRKLWQYFAVLTDTQTVGVRGDARAYGYTVAVRAVQSIDGMTAHWAHLPAGLLERISNRITNEIKSVNRVVYDISSKPPATIEWE